MMSASSQLINNQSKSQTKFLIGSGNIQGPEGKQHSSQAREELKSSPGRQYIHTPLLVQRSNVESQQKIMSSGINTYEIGKSNCLKTIRTDSITKQQTNEPSNQSSKGVDKLFSKNLNPSLNSQIIMSKNDANNNNDANYTTGSSNPDSTESIKKLPRLFQNLTSNPANKSHNIGSIHSAKNSSLYATRSFYHTSKFFTLDQQPLQHQIQVNQIGINNNFKKQKNVGSLITSKSDFDYNGSFIAQNRIPDIEEWFSSLSLDDRVLCLTCIDPFFAQSIIRMQSKNSKHGQGLFKLLSRLESIGQTNPNEPNANLSNEDKYYFKQDFQYLSIKACLTKNKEQFTLQSKQIPEKELLDFIRLTYTNLDSKDRQKTEYFQDYNTLTVSPPLVSNPQKFIELITSIVGNNFLKIPYEIQWDDQRKIFITQTPIWFEPQEPNSLASWIIFYMEISIWVHFQAYVKNNFTIHGKFLNKMIFVHKEQQFINLKNELTAFWEAICKDPFMGPVERQMIGHEIIERTKKNQQISEGQTNSLKHDGLLELEKSRRNLSIDNKLMEVLLKNQEPHKFIQELCMMGLTKLEDNNIYLMQQVFVEVLRERIIQKKKESATPRENDQVYQGAILTQTSSTAEIKSTKPNKKQLKKKLKKQRDKLKKLQEQDQIEDIQAKFQSNENLNLKKEKQEVKTSEQNEPMLFEDSKENESSEDSDEPDLTVDFCSNQQIISNQRISPQNERNRKDIDLLLNELLQSDISINKESERKVIHIVTSKPFYSLIKMEDSFELQGEQHIDEQKEQEIEENNSQLYSNDSTDDYHDATFQQQISGINFESNQAINKKKNPYSSDCGEHNGESQEQDVKNCIKIEEAQISLTSEKIYKKKSGFNKQNKKINQKTQNVITNEQDVDTTSQFISNFQIIRSSKSFNPHEGNNFQQNNQKKKKKRASKNKGATSHQGQTTMTDKMNSFMRNIIHTNGNQEDSDENEKMIQSSAQASRQKNHPKSNKTIQTEVKSIDKSSTNTTQSSSTVKQIYVKKGTITTTSLQGESLSSKEEEKLNMTTHQKRDKNSHSNEPQRDTKRIQVNEVQQKSIQSTSRFDQFINNRDPNEPSFIKHNSYDRFGMGQQPIVPLTVMNKDRKKKQVHSKKGNGKREWGQIKDNKQTNFSQKISQQQLDNQFLLQPFQQNRLLLSQLDNYDQFQQLIKEALLSNQHQQQQFQGPLTYPHEDYNLYSQIPMDHPDQQEGHHHYEKGEELDEVTEQYYEILDDQMEKIVKETERQLESVRKERETAISVIQSIVKETFTISASLAQQSFIGIKMYGSMANGLAIEQSDVDLAVVGLDFEGNRDNQILQMRKLCDQLELFMKNYIDTIKFIDTATIPVIKIIVDLYKVSKTILQRKIDSQLNDIDESMRYLGIDITFEDHSKQNYYSIENISRVNQGIQCISYIKELCMRYPDLKPIVLVLKKLLQNHNLNQPYLGGLNSYSLVLMTSTFLNLFPDIKSRSKNLGELLNYFGSYFDPQTIMIQNQQIVKTQLPLSDPMTVVDPLNELNNTTRSAYRIRDIQELFRKAYQYLNDNLDQFRLHQSVEQHPDGMHLIIKHLTEQTDISYSTNKI